MKQVIGLGFTDIDVRPFGEMIEITSPTSKVKIIIDDMAADALRLELNAAYIGDVANELARIRIQRKIDELAKIGDVEKITDWFIALSPADSIIAQQVIGEAMRRIVDACNALVQKILGNLEDE